LKEVATSGENDHPEKLAGRPFSSSFLLWEKERGFSWLTPAAAGKNKFRCNTSLADNR